ncbi:PilZ domain-containing protein [Desulfopila inferna]|uniref:PilZ domain-containing protein n=1 Tax=Desulfopila inferna TaxID=468528 RepID=UPI0019651C29|nr:PilZ domain-containing protein [Desulfopila inferna]MBM9605163.1 PilZ domain-containing protein [Desulfopila inferna]
MTDSSGGESQERREVERKYLVYYLRVFDGMSSKVLGHIINLSSRGAMLLSDDAIAVNKDFRLRIQLPAEASERRDLMLDATSLWCKKDTNPNFFLAGFQIHDLKLSEKNDIHHLLDKLSYLED